MAQLTLSQKKNKLAQDAVFVGRILQGLFSKANYFNSLGTTPTFVAQKKRKDYALPFLKNVGVSLDISNVSRFWLANYNVEHDAMQLIDAVNTPIGFDEVTGIPYDQAILSTGALDVVYNSLAGVVAGDESLPIG